MSARDGIMTKGQAMRVMGENKMNGTPAHRSAIHSPGRTLVRKLAAWLVACLLLGAFCAPDVVQAASVGTVVAGPYTVTLPNTKLFSYSTSFRASSNSYIVRVQLSAANSLTALSVNLNGTQVIGLADFNGGVTLVDRVVTLAASNTIALQVAGVAGTKITITVYNIDMPKPTALTPSPLALSLGATGQLSATLTPAATLGGTLSVTSSNSAIATVPTSIAFAAGQSTVTVPVTAVALGSATITVSANSKQASATINVNPAISTTTLSSSANPSTAGQAIMLTATVTGSSPTGTVTFKDGTTTLGTGTIASGVATLSYTFNTAGSHSLTASYGGDANNNVSTSTAVSQTVNKATTVTTLSASPNPSTAGQAVTLTATVTGVFPNGTVTFNDGATVLGTATITAGTATLSYTFNIAGTHSLTASYAGDANNTVSASSAIAQTVNPAISTTTLSATPNPSTAGQAVTLTATVTGAAPGGTVTFNDGATALGTATIASGQATLSYTFNTAGAHSLTASYGGDANNTASTAAVASQTVNKATTVTTLSASPNPSTAGQAVTLTANVTGVFPSGTVTFNDGATVLGTATIASGTASLSYTFNTAGSHSLTASYGGDANNLSSTSSAIAQTVNPAISTTTLAPNPNPSTAGQTVTLTATVTGVFPSGTVTFNDGATVLGTATIASGQATLSYTFNIAGSHNLTASYAGDANNLASTAAVASQTVNKATTVTTLSASPNPSTAGQAVTLTVTVTGVFPSGTVTFNEGTTVLGAATITAGTATLSYTFNTAGSHNLTASYAGDANNLASTAAVASQTVNTGIAQAYYIYSDQLDTPRQITDTNGNVVWQWDNTDPFGANMANENPNGQGTFNFNLRFPGQYFDKETGLHQNHFRDYDPANGGRYIQSDPIGLRGGINTYSYVGGNPLGYVDPLGLYQCAPGVNCNFTQPTQDALQCFDSCTGRDTTITGGRGNRNTPNSSHARGEACDVGRGANPDLSRDSAQQCTVQCFPRGYGQEEQNRDGGTHFHLQLNTVPGANPGFSPTVRPYQP